MKETSSSKSWRRAALIGGAALLAGPFLALVSFTNAKEGPKGPPVHFDVSTAPLSNEAKSQYPSYAPIVKKVAPSVVKVSITGKAETGNMSMEGAPDFGQFFGRQFGFGHQFGQQGLPNHQFGQQGLPNHKFQAPREHGIGSGVIVTKDGYILTNNHVVDHADEIKVSLTDGRDFTAKVIGRDPHTDLAVVKIDAKDLPAAVLGDSDKIDIGDRVLAIGNPFGIGQTVTSGIVSAKGRFGMDSGADYEDFIQTDAPINPGNSGGALVDVDGRLIGINTAILSRSGGNQGIGFAVPSNMARWVMDSLVNHGRVDRGFLGVNIQDLTPELAKEFKSNTSHGALVAEVTPNSPADKAGLKSGDLIVKFNGAAVDDSRHLKLAVGETAPGSSVPVEVMRDGASKTLTVTLNSLPSDNKVANAGSNAENTQDALHGVAVGDIDNNMRSELQLPAHLKGAVITELSEDSAAYEAGLRQGDVITEINHKPIKNAEDAVAACAKKPADNRTLVKVWSHGGLRYVVVDESKVS
jgi:serine protease Do